mgnify:FL=1
MLEVAVIVGSVCVAWDISSVDESLSLLIVVELVVCKLHERVSSAVDHFLSFPFLYLLIINKLINNN